MRLSAGCVVAVVLGIAAPAAAQQSATRPGPWVIDVRGVTSRVPTDQAFYPPLDPSVLIPARGFGLDAGAHVYLFQVGPSRVGFGAHYAVLRATGGSRESTDEEGPTAAPQRAALTMKLFAPEVSFNFGSGDGWSYLSGGMGLGSVSTETKDLLPGERDTGQASAFNVGGGARWFINRHLAFGFDLRLHRIGSTEANGVTTPATSSFMVGAGLSFR